MSVNINSTWKEIEWWQDSTNDPNQNVRWRLIARCEEDVSGNYSNVYFWVQKRITNGASGWAEYPANKSMHVTCTGAQSDTHSANITWTFGRTTSTDWIDADGDYTDAYWSQVKHNADGTATIRAYITGDRVVSGSIDTYVDLALPTIPRASTATVSSNPLTIGNLSIFDKIQVPLFQSISTRTAGFATVPQQDLTNASSILCLLLMFIGGSPVGTAGGIKTVTVAVLVVSAIATIQNKQDVSMFNRNIPKQMVNKAVAVTLMSFSIMLTSTILLSAVSNADALDILFETVSATGTVGLTRDLTPYLNSPGKMIIIGTMYLGRVGPISLALALNSRKKHQNIIKNPTEEISVG